MTSSARVSGYVNTRVFVVFGRETDENASSASKQKLEVKIGNAISVADFKRLYKLGIAVILIFREWRAKKKR